MDARAGARMVSAALVAALLAVLVPLTDATAASLAVQRRCYAEGERIDLAGAGFTPLARTRLTLARAEAAATVLRTSDDPVADVAGNVSGAFGVEERTGWFGAGEDRFRLRLTLADRLRAETVAQADVWFSRWTVAVTSRTGRLDPRRPAQLHAVGFTGDGGSPLYAHYTRAGGQRVRSVRLGTLRGACGTLDATLDRGFPFRPVRAGTWHVAFNTSATDPAAEGTIVQRAARVSRHIP